jgi:DNA/RNA endonuclease YhcR with UshA esterase domain
MKLLLKISFLISLIGIFLLMVLSNYLEPEIMKIKDINLLQINQKIKISGTIENIRNYHDFETITLKDETGKILITVDKNLNLTKNQSIIVIGRVSEYKNQTEIRSEKILQQ